jgi:hypothetical protein
MKNLLLTGLAFVAFTTVSIAQNTATLDQNGSFNQADLNQAGLGNRINARQDGTGAGSVFNVTRVRQSGSNAGTNNISNSNQVGRDHFINAYQEGTRNRADFFQTQQSTSVTTQQIGSLNEIVSNQRSAIGTKVVAELQQTGSNNNIQLTNQTDVIDLVDFTYAYVYQRGNENDAYLVQMGDANTATISQDNNWNLAFGRQEGTSNKLRITQVGINATSSLYNWADVFQFGTGNDSRTYQIGRSNTIALKVTGSNNFADLNQNGTNHLIRGISGDLIGQSGTNNRLTVSQNGNNQLLNVSQVGNTNQAFVLQQN